MNRKIFKNIEWGILICVVILLCIGLFALFSATQDRRTRRIKKTTNVAIYKYSHHDNSHVYRL